MHGLINRAIQGFLTETYGADRWARIACAAEVDPRGFEALLTYDPALTEAVIAAAVDALGKPRNALLEDLGTFLVSHPSTERMRRLLRFGGLDFADFMNTLDELPGRARLAVPGFRLPDIETRDEAPDAYLVMCRSDFPGYGSILAGLLRAMADDYGALAVIESIDGNGQEERVAVRLLAGEFAEGRQFNLSGRQALR